MLSKTLQWIRKRSNLIPKIGIILGSGLGAWTSELNHATTMLYDDIPQFPSCQVEGHRGQLHLGWSYNVPVACLEGRPHLYEHPPLPSFKIWIRTLKALGCELLLVTNAVGSLNPSMPVGSLVLIKDHLNLQFRNPLIGPNDTDFGPRFISMDEAYDSALRQQLLYIANMQDIPLHEGVFAGVLGPSFETPAEIRMLKTLGADVVAMSLIPEIIVANHCGMRAAAISAVSNWAAGVQQEEGSLQEDPHTATLRGAHQAAPYLTRLLSSFLKAYSKPS